MSRLNKTGLEVLELGTTILQYNFIRTRRKSIQISIFPDQRVEVRAPIYASKADVQKMIKQKADWILKKLTEFKKYEPRIQVLNYENGEKHFYLGKAYNLEIMTSRKNEIQILDNVLRVYTRNPDKTYIKKMLDKWYFHQAGEIFSHLISEGLQKMQKYNLPQPSLKIRKMKTRWGSCSTKHSITLNLELIKYNLEHIEYVVMHEISHMVEHNHSKRFYAVLASVMPDWKTRQKELNRGKLSYE